jgi:hypothetical protein
MRDIFVLHEMVRILYSRGQSFCGLRESVPGLYLPERTGMGAGRICR